MNTLTGTQDGESEGTRARKCDVMLDDSLLQEKRKKLSELGHGGNRKIKGLPKTKIGRAHRLKFAALSKRGWQNGKTAQSTSAKPGSKFLTEVWSENLAAASLGGEEKGTLRRKDTDPSATGTNPRKKDKSKITIPGIKMSSRRDKAA